MAGGLRHSVLVRFLRTFALLSVASVLCSAETAAEKIFKEGESAEKKGDLFHAFLLFSEAVAMEPSNAQFAARKAALEESASTIARAKGGDRAEVWVEPNAPGDRPVRLPPRLKAPEGLKSFDFSGDSRTVIEKVMAAYGVTVVFEPGYQDPPRFRFKLENVGFDDAVRTLEAVSESFLVPMNDHLALMVRDTAQKRNEMAPAMSIAIPIPERFSAQDAQEMMTAVAQTLEIKKFQLDPGKRTIFMRDEASKILAARALLDELSQLRAQVEVDIEFLEVSKTSALGYGLQLPTASSIVNFSSFMGNTASAVNGLSQYIRFGAGASLFGIGIASSAVMATFTKSDSDVIMKSKVVAVDGQPTTLHVGEQYPIVTASYSGGSTSSIANGASGLIAPPTITYTDLGFLLKVTPSIHDEGEVTLEVSAEYKVLGTFDANGNPTILNRKYDGKVRLRLDESAIVAGLFQETRGDTISGYPGISRIPILGKLLSTTSINKGTDEVLLLLRPRLLNQPPWESPAPSVWVGTETKALTLF